MSDEPTVAAPTGKDETPKVPEVLPVGRHPAL